MRDAEAQYLDALFRRAATYDWQCFGLRAYGGLIEVDFQVAFGNIVVVVASNRDLFTCGDLRRLAKDRVQAAIDSLNARLDGAA